MKQILIIDQDINTFLLLENFLENKDFLIIGEKSEETILQYPDSLINIDIVLLSCKTLNNPPTEVLNRILSYPDVPPIIMLTERGDEQLAIETLAAGAWNYLMKPLSKEILCDVIDEAIQLSARKTLARKILVVDDSLVIVTLVKNILEYEGFDITTAKNGIEALELLETFSPDLILLDVMMPGKDGWEVCKLIKSNPLTQTIPVIMLTAMDNSDNVVDALTLGADDYIIKPFHKEELIARVRSMLRLKGLQEEVDRANALVIHRNLRLNEDLVKTYKSLTFRIEQLSTLHKVGQSITAILELNELLELIYNEISKVLYTYHFQIALYESENNIINYELDVIDNEHLEKHSSPLEKSTLIDFIIKGQTPLLLRSHNDINKLPFANIDKTKIDIEESFLGVPMLSRDEVIGIIIAQAPNPNVFDEEQMQMVSTIANQAAIAIQNARLYYSVLEAREKEHHVRHIFQKYVPKEVVDTVLKRESSRQLIGEIREVTIVFVNIKHFTRISQNLLPEEVVNLLNDYFSDMVSVVMSYNGILDKFIGDILMALFGVPISKEDDAIRAISAALEMRRILKTINTLRRFQNEPEIHFGIGINTGEVIAGNIGSQERMSYTVIGDVVNTTARIEQLTASNEDLILLGEGTYQQVKELIEVKAWKPVKVKGKREELQVYELIGMIDK